jgi:hypothetical protein
MKTSVNISTEPFQNLDEIVRATGRSWRTVRKRLEEAKCYPLPPDLDRGDALALFDDGPLPTYTAAEQQEISARIDALLAVERACKRGKPKGTR